MKKIANIACAWPPYASGIANSAKQISDLLSEKHSVDDFSPEHLKPWLRYGHGAFFPQLLWRLKNYDYIYFHYPFFGTTEIIWLFKVFYRRPKLIIHYHMNAANLSFPANLLSLPGKLIAPLLFKQADQIVCSSLDYIASGPLKKYYLRHREKFREIPFGLDTEKFKPPLLKEPAGNPLVKKAQDIINFVNDRYIKRKKCRLLFVGGLDKAHYFKGIPVLLQALSPIDRSRFHLDIVGDGDCRPEYETLTESLNLSDNVSFLGRLNDNELVRAYQKSDLFILPSINGHEAFGIVLIEALACGVAVIASNLPGVRQVFQDNHEGLLAEPGNPDDLRKKITVLLENDQKRHDMANAARRLAENKYSLALMKERLNTLIR